MYLRFTKDKDGNRKYTLKLADPETKLYSLSAHPARFSPDNKMSQERIIWKQRHGVLLTQLPKPDL